MCDVAIYETQVCGDFCKDEGYAFFGTQYSKGEFHFMSLGVVLECVRSGVPRMY